MSNTSTTTFTRATIAVCVKLATTRSSYLASVSLSRAHATLISPSSGSMYKQSVMLGVEYTISSRDMFRWSSACTLPTSVLAFASSRTEKKYSSSVKRMASRVAGMIAIKTVAVPV